MLLSTMKLVLLLPTFVLGFPTENCVPKMRLRKNRSPVLLTTIRAEDFRMGVKSQLSPLHFQSPLVSHRMSSLSLRSTLQERSDSGNDKAQETKAFLQLCELLDVKPAGLLRLEQCKKSGIRGVFANRSLSKGDMIMSISLSFCLRDNQTPSWMMEIADDLGGLCNPSAWATRLAAILLDRQLDRERDHATALWLSLLPDPDHLRASLPIHWSESVLLSAQCTALELAVDTAFFPRAHAIEVLLKALNSIDDAIHAIQHMNEAARRSLCENALDIVQTRTSRLGEDDRGLPLRVLAPVFDFINHPSCGSANAYFALEGGASPHLVVRATREITDDSEVVEVFVVVWFCSELQVGCLREEDATHLAEVLIEGSRYQVGPTTIPGDMVAALARILDPSIDENAPLQLTSTLAIESARRLSDAASQLIAEPTDSSSLNTRNIYDCDDVEEVCVANSVASQLSGELRLHQHRVLMACSLGLRDFATANNDT
ncbi:predicted protein [Phaeodactylum tricornutum CCAP 1055/1]|uniref:SET domain-containing protein n=1 Tax=Phaeodactylum tricornutum (strain CCAP 1055/1) TaxID=556484 RepID=B7G2B0_PHATC|nr:predicted protein [Phaeodactylum tricornutum CCAP 1055/1]EEC47100.1 predicted protein [Phaeodactylum tricornutum CCAP 1055/1]|eukprot:XP_002181177.1 predicted protein [Phaeodactylum tricornutum CCAP 1055/1]